MPTKPLKLNRTSHHKDKEPFVLGNQEKLHLQLAKCCLLWQINSFNLIFVFFYMLTLLLIFIVCIFLELLSASIKLYPIILTSKNAVYWKCWLHIIEKSWWRELFKSYKVEWSQSDPTKSSSNIFEISWTLTFFANLRT